MQQQPSVGLGLGLLLGLGFKPATATPTHASPDSCRVIALHASLCREVQASMSTIKIKDQGKGQEISRHGKQDQLDQAEKLDSNRSASLSLVSLRVTLICVCHDHLFLHRSVPGPSLPFVYIFLHRSVPGPHSPLSTCIGLV